MCLSSVTFNSNKKRYLKNIQKLKKNSFPVYFLKKNIGLMLKDWEDKQSVAML